MKDIEASLKLDLMVGMRYLTTADIFSLIIDRAKANEIKAVEKPKLYIQDVHQRKTDVQSAGVRELAKRVNVLRSAATLEEKNLRLCAKQYYLEAE